MKSSISASVCSRMASREDLVDVHHHGQREARHGLGYGVEREAPIAFAFLSTGSSMSRGSGLIGMPGRGR